MDLPTLTARVRSFYAADAEPLRRRVYTALLAVVAAAITAGIVTSAWGLVLPVVLAQLLLVPATEAARSRVMPVASLAVECVPELEVTEPQGRHAKVTTP